MEEFLTNPEEVFGLDDTEFKIVEVEAWGNRKVRIRGLTSGELGRWEREVRMAKKNPENWTLAQAKAVALGVVDGQGKRIFVTKDAAVQLSKKSAKAIGQLFKEIMDMSSVSDAEVEELEGNFG